MIPEGVPIYEATTPVDLRFGMEGMRGLVREWMGQEARTAALFVFIGTRRTPLKVVSSDATGVLLLGKHLDVRKFAVPVWLPRRRRRASSRDHGSEFAAALHRASAHTRKNARRAVH